MDWVGKPGDVIGSVVHDFHERLEFSAKLSDETSWMTLYKEVWPTLVSATRLDRHSEWQRDGIDRVIFLENGRQLLIDEKKREATDKHGRPYLDVLLEEWSVFHGESDSRNKVGWALDVRKRCDFVAYAIPLAGLCYLLPFELLRLAFTEHRSEWLRSFGSRVAQNVGYVTRNVPVSWDVLSRALKDQMLKRFNGQKLQLPKPFVVLDQLTFTWGNQ